mmetsp:Transcript_54276/g.116589  ORF Transcript_54276/g.116589 Transcript_54276/m.116589 type:complete len:229 (-) Transcript_54276:3174-3860(-)
MSLNSHGRRCERPPRRTRHCTLISSAAGGPSMPCNPKVSWTTHRPTSIAASARPGAGPRCLHLVVSPRQRISLGKPAPPRRCQGERSRRQRSRRRSSYGGHRLQLRAMRMACLSMWALCLLLRKMMEARIAQMRLCGRLPRTSTVGMVSSRLLPRVGSQSWKQQRCEPRWWSCNMCPRMRRSLLITSQWRESSGTERRNISAPTISRRLPRLRWMQVSCLRKLLLRAV